MDHVDIQKQIDHPKGKRSRLLKIGTFLLLGLGASGCNVTMSGMQGTGEGIGYRQARFVEMNEMKAWRSCQEQALKLGETARSNGSASQYLASAKALKLCETSVSSQTAGINIQERMRSIAVASLNFLRGGNIEKARSTFEDFKTHFKGNDLRFADGSSYLDTMKMLLGMDEPTSIGALSMANVNSSLKAELRRTRYWERN